ncbi:MAG: protein-glutamate O-methyltransferase [Phycisphaerae bacterium]|nr:protein-glutamate O-methyltransferase [Phycisphaerae bacterium]
MPADTLPDIEITTEEYERVRKLVYERAGINLGSNRQHLVQARLAKRIRSESFAGFRDYFRHLDSETNNEEITHLIDAISTNTTFFFRESDHFDFLAESLVSRIKSEKWDEKQYTLRIWSAACSSGEEPYTLAMVINKILKEYPSINAKILATDISQKILAQACAGQYDAQKIKSVPDEYRRHAFRHIGKSSSLYEISPEISKYITFAYFNLMTPQYPFKFGFDYIFCRNVMIYFDRPTQESVINRMAQHIRPNGYLIVGHSESLNGLRHKLEYVKPTIYRQKG